MSLKCFFFEILLKNTLLQVIYERYTEQVFENTYMNKLDDGHYFIATRLNSILTIPE